MAVIADYEIIPAVMAKIAGADYYSVEWRKRIMNGCDCWRCEMANDRSIRYAAAADKLRDFATVELLCEGLGITRKELK